jgi:bifunctional DNA-binding transcriptional regulator/antitoxin component of YhaV-PrlF toxin-antitoxin module
MEDEIIVGKKGEILPKKPLREFAGISPGDRVLVEASPNKLVINKILSVDELMELPRISRETPEEIEKQLDEEGRNQEAR